jgi:hypothetical protein
MDVDDPEYLSYLTSLHLSDLILEPAKLNSSSAQLTNVLTTLCHTSYPTFISVHQSVNTLSTSLDAFSSSLDALIDVLPAVEQKAKGFLEEVKDVQAERKRMKVVVENLGRVEEIVGVGSVVEGCVRSGWYGEAVEVEMRIASLARKLDPDGRGVVWDVKAEVDQRIRSMVGDLLSGLRESGTNKLPVLFKTVGFSEEDGSLGRRRDRSSVFELQVGVPQEIFGRPGRGEEDFWAFTPVTPSFQSSVSGERYLKRYVDVWREGFTISFLSSPRYSSSDRLRPPRPRNYCIRFDDLHHPSPFCVAWDVGDHAADGSGPFCTQLVVDPVDVLRDVVQQDWAGFPVDHWGFIRRCRPDERHEGVPRCSR